MQLPAAVFCVYIYLFGPVILIQFSFVTHLV